MHLTHTHSLWTTWPVLGSVGLHLCREVGCLAASSGCSAIHPPLPSLPAPTWPTPPPPISATPSPPSNHSHFHPASFHVRSGSVAGIHCCCLIQWQRDAWLPAWLPHTHAHRQHWRTCTHMGTLYWLHVLPPIEQKALLWGGKRWLL